MKVLLLNDYATATGGAEILNYDLRERLRERGHDARIFASSAGAESQENFADYSCLGVVVSPQLLPRAKRLIQVANLSAMMKLRQVLRDFNPDVVHVTLFLTQLSPLILPLLKDVPSMYYAVWQRAICPTGMKLLPDNTDCTERFGKVCLTNGCLELHDWLPLMAQMNMWFKWRSSFDMIVAGSNALKEQLVQDGVEPVEVLWHGVPVKPARPPLKQPPTAAFAGRLVRQKGVQVLLQAFAQVVKTVPDAKLIVIGDGPERENLVNLAKQLAVAEQVRFTGLLSRDQTESELRSAWIQVVPSMGREAFGLVAAEAMMRGTAVVAAASGGLVELVLNGLTGSLVPRGDADALAGSMTSFLQDLELSERIGANARNFALEKLSSETYVDNVLLCFDRLLHQAKRKQPG